MHDKLTKMTPAKFIILFFVFSTAVSSCATVVNWVHGENKENINAKISSSRQASDCEIGACKDTECNCCPGYGVRIGSVFNNRRCGKCHCSGDYNCTFEGIKKTCLCPNGYGDKNGKCVEISTGQTTSTSKPTTTPTSKQTTLEHTSPSITIETTEPTKIDGCILKMINKECNKPNEYCEGDECKCRKNYKYSIDKKSCEDINECSSRTHSCPENTTCINTYGSYECVCKDGFRRKTGNLDPKKHGCEVSVTVSEKRDKKYIFIIGGVIGASFIIILIIVVTFYRKLKKSRNVGDTFNEHGQKKTYVEIIRLERNENCDSGMIPASIHKNRKLTDKEMVKSNRMPGNRIISRVQLSHDNNSDQVCQDSSSICEISSDAHEHENQRVQSSMQYFNKAYDFEG